MGHQRIDEHLGLGDAGVKCGNVKGRNQLNLGFYSQITGLEKHGALYLPAYFGMFIESLTDYLDHVRLFVHQAEGSEQDIFDSRISRSNFDYILLPSRKSFPHQYFLPDYYLSDFKNGSADLDVMLLRGPTPLTPAIAKKFAPKPSVLMIVGDQLTGAQTSDQPLWRKQLIMAYWKLVYASIHKIAKKSLVIANSEKQYSRYKPLSKKVVQTRTTTLRLENIRIRENNELHSPVRLIFSGRIELEKGILEIIKAVGLLVKEGEDVVLEFVGWSQKPDLIQEKINQTALENGVEDRVRVAGYVPAGKELFERYADSDIFVIASPDSEGFPRSIWEALAQGVSVVATKVGSIPDFTDGAGELIDSSEPTVIAAAIKKLIHDPEARANYREKGYSIVQEITLEKQTKKMVDEIAQWINGK